LTLRHQEFSTGARSRRSGALSLVLRFVLQEVPCLSTRLSRSSFVPGSCNSGRRGRTYLNRRLTNLKNLLVFALQGKPTTESTCACRASAQPIHYLQDPQSLTDGCSLVWYRQWSSSSRSSTLRCFVGICPQTRNACGPLSGNRRCISPASTVVSQPVNTVNPSAGGGL
jgi:hypothetical protein